MSAHLDLDALADVLAGEATDDQTRHVAECPDCTAGLAELRSASTEVQGALARLPEPALPGDLADRLHAALAGATGTADDTHSGATVTTLPPASPRADPRRWLPAAAAAVVLLAGAGYGLSRLGSGGSSSSASSAGGAKAAAPAPELTVVRNDSGTDYTGRAALAAKLPQLLAGTATGGTADAAGPARGAQPLSSDAAQTKAMAAPDPLARLRDNTGLADCLLALLPPDDPSVRPLALDYGSFKGTPALVVVLPSALPRKLDVFVVGAGCSRANDSTLFYTSVDKP